MNHIKRRKNGGDLIIEPLENIYDDLKYAENGKEYVYLGKHNRVLKWKSPQASVVKMGRVIWDYGLKDRDSVVCSFDKTRYDMYYR